MVQKFTIFETLSKDEKLEDDFNNFFYSNNLTSLFTNEHRAGHITVPYTDMKAVVNENGAYVEILKEFSDILNMATDNKKYEQAVFKILYTARSFKGMVNIIKKIVEHEKIAVEDRHKFNLWNIVFYAKALY